MAAEGGMAGCDSELEPAGLGIGSDLVEFDGEVGVAVALMAKMKAALFIELERFVLDEKPVPEVGPLDALLRVTTTTICLGDHEAANPGPE